MRRRWPGVERRHGNIVLVVFGQFGLGVGKLQNFELIGVGENHYLLCDGVDMSFQDLVHNLQLAGVPCEVGRVVQAHG